MTNNVLLTCKRNLRNWLKYDHDMIKFQFFSKVNSTILNPHMRLKLSSLKCIFTLKLVVVLPQIFKRASVASVVIL